MENQNYIYLNRKAILAAMISAAFPIGAHAAAGKVEFASGGATIQSADGTSKTMVKGMEINQGDTILTGAGRAQVKFSDGGYISFQPNTQFKIEEYNFNGKQDGTERGFFRLVEGGLRALTGFVGRENRPNYRMSTPVATIGIRGSYYLAEFREKLRTHVGHGSIYVFNEQGNIILFEGQGATVESGKAPGYSDEDLTLGARGPEGGQPQETNEQQQAENQNNEIFSVSEQYGDDGISTGIDKISAVIANLNGIGAEGYYRLDETVANVGGGEGWTSKINPYSTLVASFGTYTMYANIGIDSTKAGVSSAQDYFYGTGKILPSGTFAVTTPGSSGYSYVYGYGGSTGSGLCYTGCTLNLIGLFSGAQAEKISVGYVIKGVGDSTAAALNMGVVTGNAGFIANPPPAPPPSSSTCLSLCP